MRNTRQSAGAPRRRARRAPVALKEVCAVGVGCREVGAEGAAGEGGGQGQRVRRARNRYRAVLPRRRRGHACTLIVRDAKRSQHGGGVAQEHVLLHLKDLDVRGEESRGRGGEDGARRVGVSASGAGGCTAWLHT